MTRGFIVRDGGCYMAVPVGQISALHLASAADIVDARDGQGRRVRVARIEGQDLPVYTLPPLPGAALPDGTVAPVVNLLRLLADPRPAATLRAEEKEVVEREPVALIVDDSMRCASRSAGRCRGRASRC